MWPASVSPPQPGWTRDAGFEHIELSNRPQIGSRLFSRVVQSGSGQTHRLAFPESTDALAAGNMLVSLSRLIPGLGETSLIIPVKKERLRR